MNLAEVISKIESFRMLKKEWDGYNADPLTERAIEAGIECAKFLYARFPELANVAIFNVSPCVKNEIGFEFTLNGNEFYVVANPVVGNSVDGWKAQL